MCNIDEMCDISRCPEDGSSFNEYYKNLALQHIYKHEVEEQQFCELKSKFQQEQDNCNKHMNMTYSLPNAGKLNNSIENLAYHPPIVAYGAQTAIQKTPNKPSKARKQLCKEMKVKTPDHLRPFECPFCKKRFTQKGNMQTHSRLHTGEKPFQCLLCPEKFPQLSNLNKHILNHTNDNLKCNVCFKDFNSQEELKEHRKTHKADKQYLCYFCSKKFSYRWSLDTHMQLHHKDQSIKKEPTEKNIYKCEMCSLEFNFKTDLEHHEKDHVNNQHYCSKCSKTFRCLGHLNNHLKKCAKHFYNVKEEGGMNFILI